MKKILLIISVSCMLSLTASYAQSSASVLSPGTPTAKISMSDVSSDQSVDPAVQTQTAPQSQTAASAKPEKKDKKKAEKHDEEKEHFACTKDGCTHHHEKDKPCCKKDEKKDKKPTFMQDPKKD